MTANDKRRFMCSRMMEVLGPYGYFSRFGQLWKYSVQGKYVINISFDLTRFGDINDVYINFSSLYAPIRQSHFEKHHLCLNGFIALLTLIRVMGYKDIGFHPAVEFEQQFFSADQHFTRLVLPHLLIREDLADYLNNASDLLKLSQLEFMRPLYSISEICYARLSLGQSDAAIKAIEKYLEECAASISYINQHSNEYQDNGQFEKEIWAKKMSCAEYLRQRIQYNDIETILHTAEITHTRSLTEISNFFKFPKGHS